MTARVTRGDLALVPVGFLVAVVGALCGIGGGLFAVPILHFVRRLELKRAVASGLLLVLVTTAGSTVTEALRPDPDLTWSRVLPVVAGVLVGAQLGFLASRRISTRALRGVFVVVLFLAGLRLFLSSSGAETGVIEIQGGATGTLLALLAGLGGGFVAPLLGVGGGLVMVPTLFLGLGLPFGEARATSLAAGAVGALRSLVLHAKDGRVDFRAGAPLALGALGGSIAGVWAVHLEGAAEVGRLLLAAILWFTAGRFALEVWRARGGEAADSP